MLKFFFALCVVAVSIPALVYAYPFGGQASIVRPCYNSAIFTRLGPPRGGDFVWTPSTRTYEFGPPRSVGQWLLGLASVPYHCVVSLAPIDVWPGDAIMMMGSSQASGFNFGGGTPGGGVPLTSRGTLGAENGLADRNAGVQYIMVSEVYANVDPAHGTDPDNEWVELYNPSDTAFDISEWRISDASSAVSLPAGTSMPAHSRLIITPSATTQTKWSIPSTVQVLVLGRPIGDGLSPSGDRVVFSDENGIPLDGLSWGTDTNQFRPGVSAPAVGQSLIRATLSKDTDLSSDWMTTATPNPGR